MAKAVVGALSASPADALEAARETNGGAVQVLGDETLREIARELIAGFDWTLRENVRASLRKHGHPPDKREKATPTWLEQAEVLAGWGLGRRNHSWGGGRSSGCDLASLRSSP